MTKKMKNRQKHKTDASFADTSDEELIQKPSGKSCQHVTRAIHFGQVKKALQKTKSILSCSGCSTEDAGEESPELWLCLRCGNRGCGRSSENQHALQHFKTPHSDCHSLTLSTLSSIVWCYECDDAVDIDSSRILKQFVTKLTSILSNHINICNKNTDSSQHLIQNLSVKEEISVNKSIESETYEENMKSVKNIKQSAKNVSIKGLRNLGNTCFFNAVMQNLNQTPLLIHELTNTCTPTWLWEVPELDVVDNKVITVEGENLKLSLPRQMQLTNSLLNFFNQMNSKISSKFDVFNPSELFNEISKKCPQFRHFQEQDSHELLRQLLDNIRQEEIKRQKKALLRHFGFQNVSPEHVDSDTKERIKAYRCYASHTLVEKVFGGLLISTVLCEECKVSSQIFEPFMDLSLPLFEEKPLRNRKSDVDEDQHADYVLPKPKHDRGKLSKHQEKKQKQLAKKQLKRNRHAKEKNIGVIKNKDDQDLVEEKSAENDRSEEKQSETGSVKVKFASSTEEKSTTDIKNIDDDDDDGGGGNFSMCNNQNLDNSHHSVDLRTNLDVNCKTVYDFARVQGCKASCSGNIIQGVKNISFHNKSDDCEIENISTDKKMHVPLKAENIDKEDSEKDNHLNKSSTNNETHISGCDQNDIITDLSRNLSSCLISTNSNQSNIDDRIQALSMQVKDVRIRRDSDKQEMLLNSSESADENESQRARVTSSNSSVEESCSNENSDNWSLSVSEQETKEWILKSLTTLKPRHNASPMECSIRSCLSHFTKPELLTGNNKFRCENCTAMKIKKSGNKKDVAYSNASKQILIFSPPAVLTLHLKRFQQVGMSLRKVNRFVEFPLILDLAPFCSSACVILPHTSSVEDEILYSLYGIVEHSGRLTSGHYTAYVKANKKTANSVFECLVPLGQSNLEQLLHRFSYVNRSSLHNHCDRSQNECSQWFYISDNHVKEVSEAQILKCQAYLLFYERIK